MTTLMIGPFLSLTFRLTFQVELSCGIVLLEPADTFAIARSADESFQLLERIIQKIGVEDVAQVITSGASAYCSANVLLKRSTHIF